jgi:hypothetical protein
MAAAVVVFRDRVPMKPTHPTIPAIAIAGITAVVVAAASLAGCVSKKDADEARASVYDIDFAIAYSEALAAVRARYPNLTEDPVKGTIRTAWHQVNAEVAQNEQSARDPAGLTGGGGAQGLTSSSGTALRRTFIRFDVSVTGGRPWRIKVVGRASRWEPGAAQPVELRNADAPPWLAGRTDALVIDIHERLAVHARPAPRSEPVDDAPPALDLAAFGPIPTAAAEGVARVRQAITGRDLAALRAATAADVTWSFGAEPGIDGAMITWQADPEVLEHMATALDAGCRTVDDRTVSCPPAASEQPEFLGWRAVFQPRDGRWVMTAFVQGD